MANPYDSRPAAVRFTFTGGNLSYNQSVVGGSGLVINTITIQSPTAVVGSLSDISNGDYVEMAVGTANTAGDVPTAYHYFSGFIRRLPSNDNLRFMLTDDEAATDGSSYFWSNVVVTSEAHVVVVFPRKTLPLDRSKMTTRLTMAASGMTAGQSPIQVRAASTFTLTSDALAVVSANERLSLRGRSTLTVGTGELETPMVSLPLDPAPTVFTVGAGSLSSSPALIPGTVSRFSTRGTARLNLAPNMRVAGLTVLTVSSARLELEENLLVPSSTVFESRGKVIVSGGGLTLRDIAGDVLSVWNKRLSANLQTDVKDRVMIDINSALQLIYSRAKWLNYFNRETQTVTIPASQTTVALSNRIQSLLGEVRLDDAGKTTLWPANTLGEIENFGVAFQGLANGQAGTPVAYYLDRRGSSSSESLTFHVAPSPEVDTDVLIEVALDAPRFGWLDVENAASIQLPHDYVEALLLPLCRMAATSYRLFVDGQEKSGTITQQYYKARQMLGLVDPVSRQAMGGDMAKEPSTAGASS